MNKILPIIIVIIVVAGGAFYGGMKYTQSKAPQRFMSGNLEERQHRFQQAGIVGMMGAGDSRPETGEIISKDETSITIKLRDGGSKIIFYSDSAEISKFASGTAIDLEIGKSVMVNGKTNQDGSITAQSIQLR